VAVRVCYNRPCCLVGGQENIKRSVPCWKECSVTKANFYANAPRGVFERIYSREYSKNEASTRPSNELKATNFICESTLMNNLSFGSMRTGKTTTKKIGFYFFTYEWSRRRLSLIKMIHGVEEVLILLFTAFRYEYLFLKCRRTRLKSEVVIWEKILIVETHDQKTEKVKPKLSGEKNVATNIFRVLLHLYINN
jgi:hypothetical protein